METKCIQFHCAPEGHNYLQCRGEVFGEWNEVVSGNFEGEALDNTRGGVGMFLWEIIFPFDLNRQILAKYRVGDYTPAEAENAGSTMSDSS